MEKKWTNIPYKERNLFPISYPGVKQETDQLKKIKTGEIKSL